MPAERVAISPHRPAGRLHPAQDAHACNVLAAEHLGRAGRRAGLESARRLHGRWDGWPPVASPGGIFSGPDTSPLGGTCSIIKRCIRARHYWYTRRFARHRLHRVEREVVHPTARRRGTAAAAGRVAPDSSGMGTAGQLGGPRTDQACAVRRAPVDGRSSAGVVLSPCIAARPPGWRPQAATARQAAARGCITFRMSAAPECLNGRTRCADC